MLRECSVSMEEEVDYGDLQDPQSDEGQSVSAFCVAGRRLYCQLAPLSAEHST